MLALGRSLAYSHGGGRTSGSRHQRGVQTGTANQRLRSTVRRLQQPELALQARQRQHSVLLEGSGELFGGEAVNLVSTVGDEVEDEPQLGQLFREALHLVIGHAGGVPVEGR